MVDVTIEMPKGSNVKYEIQPDGKIHIDRILDVLIPFAYGFINGTKAPDGDAQDVFVVEQDQSYPTGHILKAKIIGKFVCMDNGVSDDKYVAFSTNYRPQLKDLMTIERYLTTYKPGFEVLDYESEDVT